MFCPDCGLKNRDGAKFCADCGRKLLDIPGFVPVPDKKGKTVVRKPPAKKEKKVKKISRTPVLDSTTVSHIPSAPTPISPPSPQLTPLQAQPAGVSTLPHTPVSLAAAPPQLPPAPSGSLPVGNVLDNRYKILQHIATGGMGAIYRGEDIRLNTTVAIKEMLDFFQNQDDRNYAIQRFREEALLLADLRHPNIPRVTDNFIQNNRYYLIMDFVEGKNTEKILRENAGRGLPVERVVNWAIQISDVLYYLHTHQPPIIYRDMKPSNIMIKDDDTVMLVDFGIARHFTPRRPGTQIGTHGYAPPEQYKGNAEPRSDIYSLSATLHHLLSGNDPTQGVPFNFKLLRYWRKDISEELEKIIERGLQNLPDLRFANAMEMKTAFLSLRGISSVVSTDKAASGGVSSTQSVPFFPPSPSTAPHAHRVPKGRLRFDARKYFENAQEYLNKGRPARAKKDLEKALAINPDYPDALSLMGYVLTKMNNPSEALKYLNRSISLNYSSATAHLYMAKAYERMGDSSEARKEYQIASKLNPQLFKQQTQSFLEKLIRSFLT